jgi:transposase
MTQVLGIDISKETFDACLMVEEGNTWQEKFDNTPAGFKKMQRWVSKHTSERDVPAHNDNLPR